MKLTTLDRPLPVPTHDCAQIATILKAAGHSHHPLGTAVAIAVLAPAIADRVVGAPAERFDLEVGTVDIPVGDDEWGRVALGPTVRRAAAIVMRCEGSGHFGEDQHGAPLLLDRDACDHAVDVVRWSDPRCRAFDWSVEEICHAGGVPTFPELESLCPAVVSSMRPASPMRRPSHGKSRGGQTTASYRLPVGQDLHCARFGRGRAALTPLRRQPPLPILNRWHSAPSQERPFGRIDGGACSPQG